MIKLQTEKAISTGEASVAAPAATPAQRVSDAATAILEKVSFPQDCCPGQIRKMVDGSVTPGDLHNAKDMRYGAEQQFNRYSGRLSYTLNSPPSEREEGTSHRAIMERPMGLGRAQPNHRDALVPLFDELVQAVEARLAEQGSITTGFERVKDWIC